MKVIYPITLDCKKTNIQKTIQANTGEGNERQLVITLVSGNKEIELTTETVSVCGVKPDGTEFANSATINEDGKIEYTLTTQNVAVPGDVDCQIRVLTGSSVLYSAKFVIHVEENLTDEEAETSSNEWTELITALQEIQNISIKLYKDEGTPTTDPTDYPNVSTGNFYFDETNEKLYYSKAVTLTTVTWERIVSKDELDALLDLKADKSTTYTKTEVDTSLDLKADKATTFNKTEVQLLLNPKGTVWEGTLAPNTQISIGTTYTGIKEGDIYLYDTGVTGAQPIPCVVVYVDDVYYQRFVVNELNGVMVKSTNPPSSMAGNDFIEIKNGTMWINTTTKRVFIKIGETGEMPHTAYEWQDLTGNRVWFGDDNPDDDTALGKVAIANYSGIAVGDTYIYRDLPDYYNNEFHQYTVINTDSTYAYLKKTKNVFYLSTQLPAQSFELGTTAALSWKDWEEVFEAGTVYTYNNTTYVIEDVRISELNGKTYVQYYWDTFDFVNVGDYQPTITQIQSDIADKQDKLTAGSNVSISNNTISATDTTYTAGTNITIDSNNVISATGGSGGSYTAGDGIDISNDEISVKLYNSQDNGLMFNSDGTLALFKSVLGMDSTFRNYLVGTTTQNPLQPKLTAGTNITIDSNNVISASGGGTSYTFTDGLTESSGTVGIDLASGSKLLIDANDKLDVDLSSKQDTIDSTHKLDADNVDDTSSTNKFVPASSQADEGKFLRVDANGNAVWQTINNARGGNF